MIHRQMEPWKKFIHGRIAQEQGREEEGLREFEQAPSIRPAVFDRTANNFRENLKLDASNAFVIKYETYR